MAETITKDGVALGPATRQERSKAARLRARDRLTRAERAWLVQYERERRLYGLARAPASRRTAADRAYWSRHVGGRQRPPRRLAGPSAMARALAGALGYRLPATAPTDRFIDGNQSVTELTLPRRAIGRPRAIEDLGSIELGGDQRVGIRVLVIGPNGRVVGWRTLVPYTDPDDWDWGYAQDEWDDWGDRYGATGVGAVQIYR